MGLDLYCGDQSWGTSYSGVHMIREWFIKATIKYMENLENNPQVYQPLREYKYICNYDKDKNDVDAEVWNKNDLLVFLNQLFIKESPTLPEQLSWFKPLKLDYQPWSNTPFDLGYFGLYGLKVFVNHSDCDGVFTVGNVHDILCLLSRIGNYLMELEDVKEETDKQWILDLIELLEHSVNTKEDIIFC
jgi:hypothetical protein